MDDPIRLKYNTENMIKLAEIIVENMGQKDLMHYASLQIEKEYREDSETFHRDCMQFYEEMTQQPITKSILFECS